jgi:hypothetical protein
MVCATPSFQSSNRESIRWALLLLARICQRGPPGSSGTRCPPAGEPVLPRRGERCLQDIVQRAGNAIGIECIDEQPSIADLPPRTAAHEAPQLRLDRPLAPLRLMLQRAKWLLIALLGDDRNHGGGAESPDEFVLQVEIAAEESPRFQIAAPGYLAEPMTFEAATKHRLLPGVIEPAQAAPIPTVTVGTEIRPDRLSAAEHGHLDARSLQVEPPPDRQRLQRDAITLALHEDDRARPVRHAVEPRILRLAQLGDWPSSTVGWGSLRVSSSRAIMTLRSTSSMLRKAGAVTTGRLRGARRDAPRSCHELWQLIGAAYKTATNVVLDF